MALFLLTAPQANPGSVDKVYGANWNDLVKAITGGNTETVTIGGAFRIKAGTSFYGELTAALSGSNKTWTFPNATGTVALLSLAQTWTAVQTFPAGSIPYASLTLTGSIVDADIAASGITTRSKLPGPIAYEDEANTFTTSQTIQGVLSFGSGTDGYGITLSTGSSSAYHIWHRTTNAFGFSQARQEYSVAKPGSGGQIGFVWTNDFGDSLFKIDARDGSATFGGPVNFGSFTATNFVASSPKFTGSVLIGATAYGSEQLEIAGAGNQYQAIRSTDGGEAGFRFYFDTTASAKWALFNYPGGSNELRLNSGTGTVLQVSQAGLFTFGGDLSIGANKIKTTNIQVSETASNTWTITPFTTNTLLALRMVPSGTAVDSQTEYYGGSNVSSAERLTIGHIAGLGIWGINMDHSGGGALAAYSFRMNGNAVITIGSTNAIDLHSRAVSNFNAGGNEIAGIANLKGNSGSNLYIYTVGNADLIRLVTRDNLGAETERMRFNANAAQGSAGITSYEYLAFGAASAPPATPAIGRDAGGTIIINVPSTRGLAFQVNSVEKFAIDQNGAISIGNTVNAVSPTSPNRTITIVVGGTTYYLHAKTTND